jgi:hypothetical protein
MGDSGADRCGSDATPGETDPGLPEKIPGGGGHYRRAGLVGGRLEGHPMMAGGLDQFECGPPGWDAE